MSRARGWLHALAAVLTVSPDSMLLHFMLLYSPCSAVWETIPLILFLKYSVMGFIQVGYSVVQAGSPAILLSQVKQSWRALLLPSIFMLICQLGLTTCFMTTTAANAIMLFNLQPVWALGMGRYFLGDTAQPHTLVAMAVALSAVFLAFAPLAMSGEVEAEMPAAEGAIPRTRFGDVVALLVGVSLASYLVAYRASSMSDPEAPLSIAPALGSLGASLVAAPAAIAILVSKGEEGGIGLSSTFVLATLVDAILEAYYDIAMGLASEDITSAEVAMMMLLEIPLGPLFCYWAFREVPATSTIIGCLVLFCTLVAHGVIELRIEMHAAAKLEDGSKDGASKSGDSELQLRDIMSSRGGVALSKRASGAQRVQSTVEPTMV